MPRVVILETCIWLKIHAPYEADLMGSGDVHVMCHYPCLKGKCEEKISLCLMDLCIFAYVI